MSKLNLVTKLTVKTIGAQPTRHTIKQPTMLATVFGRCSNKEAGTSDHGEFVKFKGEFEGFNVSNGESYRSGVLIVPKVLESLLDQAITLDDVNAVDFAVEIWAEPNDKSITGYSYGVKPLIEPAESDALAQLRQLARSKMTQVIEAPLEGEAIEVKEVKEVNQQNKK